MAVACILPAQQKGWLSGSIQANLLCQIIIKAGMGLTAGYNLFLAPCSRHCWDKRRRFDGPWCRIEQWKRQVCYLMSYLRSSLHRASFLVVSVIYLWVVYRHLRFKSAETKQINEGDYAAIPSYVKLMWIWRKHSACHAAGYWSTEHLGWRYETRI